MSKHSIETIRNFEAQALLAAEERMFNAVNAVNAVNAGGKPDAALRDAYIAAAPRAIAMDEFRATLVAELATLDALRDYAITGADMPERLKESGFTRRCAEITSGYKAAFDRLRDALDKSTTTEVASATEA